MEKEAGKLLYVQLKGLILNEYKDKAYYSPLPGERELCEIYNVSRPTVRKALQVLEEDGYLVRIPGKGAFYTGPSKNATANAASNAGHLAFYNRVRLRGDYTSSRVLTQNMEMATEVVAKGLGISVGDKVFHLERLRYINDELWSLCDSYIPFDLCPQLMDYDFSNRSLHNTLAINGYVPIMAKRHIIARNATEYEAFHLGLQSGAPIYISETYSYDENHQLLEYAISRNDVYRMSIDMELYDGKPAVSLENVVL